MKNTTTERANPKIVSVLAVGLALSLGLASCANTPQQLDSTEKTQTPQSSEQESKEVESVYILDSPERYEKTTVYSVGDRVIRQVTRSVMTYETLGVENAEEAEALVSEILQLDSQEDIEGRTQTFDFKDTEVEEYRDIDYTKVDLVEMSEMPGVEFNGAVGEDTIVSFEITEEELLEKGYKKVE